MQAVHGGYVTITTLRPTGDNHVGCARSPVGAANYTAVYEESPDDDSSYVYRNSVGEVYDLYSFPASGIPSAAVIAYIRIYFRLKTGDATLGGAGATKLKTHDALYNGEWQSSAAAYTDFYTEYTLNPNTSAAWTVSEVDAILAGVRLYAASGSYYGRVTQMWITISWTVPCAAGPQIIGLTRW